jgi:methylaspartate ammonia-lyase
MKVKEVICAAGQPDFMLSKPGLGADEALMIQTNEIARTLALLQARR